MKNKFKIIGIIFILLIVCYAIYIGIERFRFYKDLGTYPLITFGAIDVDIDAQSNIQIEKRRGLGYTIEYRYITQRKTDSDVQSNKLISGEMKLFNKIILGAWIE